MQQYDYLAFYSQFFIKVKDSTFVIHFSDNVSKCHIISRLYFGDEKLS